MVPIFHKVLGDMQDFTPDRIGNHRDIVEYLRERLSSAAEDREILEIYHAVRQLCYMCYPDNRPFTDFLSNNKSRFNISSYFDIPASPASILGKWSLPEELQGHVVLDYKRQAIVDSVLKGGMESNYVIIGEPGLGKTVILFEIFDRWMRNGNAGVLTTENVGEFHIENGIKLFHDDLPENNLLVETLVNRGIKGLVVSARLEDWNEECKELHEHFTRFSIDPFSEEKMREVSDKLLDLTDIYRDKEAVDLLVKYAEGTPIYVWLMIKEMINQNTRHLSADYLKKNASKGMINYVGRLLQRLLKDGPEFTRGGYHTLTMLYFLATYMTNKECHTAYFREVSDCLDHYTSDKLQSDFDRHTQSRVMYYLSGGGDMMCFPHDAWADVLAKKGKQNPFIQDIIYIEEDIADAGIFEKVKMDSIVRAWNRMENRYSRNPNKNRESFLKFGEFLLSNFRAGTLSELGIDLEYLRELCIQHSDIESAKVILSKLDHVSKGGGNVINILGEVTGKVHIGDKRIGDDLHDLDEGAMRELRYARETEAQEETERTRVEREAKQDLYDFEIISAEMGISHTGDTQDRYRELLVEALFDQRISEDEEKMLRMVREQLGISEDEHNRLLSEIRSDKGILEEGSGQDEMAMDDVRSLLDRCKSVGMTVDVYEERFKKIKRFFGFGWKDKVKLRLPGLSTDILESLDRYMDEMGEEMIRLQDEVDELLSRCLEEDVDVEEMRGRYENILDLVRDERFPEARKGWSGLIAEMEDLVEAEESRRRWKPEAEKLMAGLDQRVEHCGRIGFELHSGFYKVVKDIERVMAASEYGEAVEKLEILIGDLDDQIEREERGGRDADIEEWTSKMGTEFVRVPEREYYLAKFPVTQGEWVAIMGTMPWRVKKGYVEGEDQPATHVSWGEAVEFIEKLNVMEGKLLYRLPTEEEWEYACRAGSTGKYCFGDDVKLLRNYAWFHDNAGNVDERHPRRVGHKKPNSWGLYDMHGNVWEWCQDWYDSSEIYKTARGGSWGDYASSCLSEYRYGFLPDTRDDYLGFRILRRVEQE